MFHEQFDPDICARTELYTWMAEDNARMQKKQTANAKEQEFGQQEGDEPFALYMAEQEAQAGKMAEEARSRKQKRQQEKKTRKWRMHSYGNGSKNSHLPMTLATIQISCRKPKHCSHTLLNKVNGIKEL